MVLCVGRYLLEGIESVGGDSLGLTESVLGLLELHKVLILGALRGLLLVVMAGVWLAVLLPLGFLLDDLAVTSVG